MKKLRIYLADVSSLIGVSFDAYYEKMPKERKEKIDGVKSEKDKLLSLLAGVLLERIKSEYDKETDEICVNKNGKPFFKKGDIFFNISHSGTKVCCAVCDCQIGCDIQKIGEYKEKIVKRFFLPTEREYIESSEDKKDAFYRLWTLKESLIKNLGGKITDKVCPISIENGDIKVPDKTFFESEIKGYKIACCLSSEEQIETSFIYC